MENSPVRDPRSGLARLALAVPPLPGTLIGITDLLDRPSSVDVDHVTRLVRHDPIVVARLLKIANSAHYGLQRTVDSAERAVDLLGPVTVAGIITGMSMLRLKSALEGPAAAPFMRLVRHSMATGRLARTISLATGVSPDRAETAFTAGLLHDIGKILLVYHEPEQALGLYERTDVIRTEAGDDVRDLEQLAFGYDHTEAGEFVARSLDFPDALVDAVRYHHEPVRLDTPTGHTDILAAVICADRSASALGFPFTRSEHWDTLCEDPMFNRHLPVDRVTLRRVVEASIPEITQVVDRLIALPTSLPAPESGIVRAGAPPIDRPRVTRNRIAGRPRARRGARRS